MVERVPEGPTVSLMQALARKHRLVMIVPVYEEDMTGVYYNTAAVIDADGAYLGKYRKNHLPHCAPGFWEKFYFRPGNLGYPVFRTRVGTIGVYICYDRHFPAGARALGLAPPFPTATEDLSLDHALPTASWLSVLTASPSPARYRAGGGDVVRSVAWPDGDASQMTRRL